MGRIELPIDGLLPSILESLDHTPNLVLGAPTGSGKTTRVPPALLRAKWCSAQAAGKVLVLEPRRLAARASAARVASELGEPLGQTVGYRVRFERKVGPKTRLEYITSGLFLRQLQSNPGLEGVSAVVFDEFHERSLESDLALAMVRNLQTELRPDLRVVVTSATLETEALCAFLEAPVLETQGRLFPVEQHFVPIELDPTQRSGSGFLQKRDAWDRAIAAAVHRALDSASGDVLVFLPGVADIRRMGRNLAQLGKRNIAIRELYGDLPFEKQAQVLQQGKQRRVILSTNVAETSLTLPGVTAVVDSGMQNRLQFDPNLGLNRLERTEISQASAKQRAGRAGREAPGHCFAVGHERDWHLRVAHEEPEIKRLDLAPAVLELWNWGEREVAKFGWFEAPQDAHLQNAEELLDRLGTRGTSGLTERGKALSNLPVHPRLGNLLLESARQDVFDSGALAAALLSERAPWERNTHNAEPAFLDSLRALDEFEHSGRTSFGSFHLHNQSARRILRVRDQLLNAGSKLNDKAEKLSSTASWEECIGRSLLSGFPDRVALERKALPQSTQNSAPHKKPDRKNEARAVMVGGRGLRFQRQQDTPPEELELFVCLELDAGRRGERSESLLRKACPIQADWLEPRLLTTQDEVDFDGTRERMEGKRRSRYIDLVLDERKLSLRNADGNLLTLAQARLQEEACRQPSKVIDPRNKVWKNLLARLACLLNWKPDLEVPAGLDLDSESAAPSDDCLRNMISDHCAGKYSFEELRQVDWVSELRGRLGALGPMLDREAPTHIRLPNDRKAALTYERGKPPVLAARIQELFSWTQSPSVAGGRVRVLLHLLAPNMRPEQITDDLASFWSSAYFDVRKDLRRRYPKHAWPEDPLSAEPDRRFLGRRH